MNLIKRFKLWQYRRAVQQERIDRVREAIRIVGRSGVDRCDTVGKFPSYEKERHS